MENTLWFGTYSGSYIGNEPVFYPVQENKLAVELEQNYELIRDELQSLWQPGSDLMDNKGNYSAFDDKQFPPNSWRKIVFKVWGIKNLAMYRRFPKTAALIDKYSGVTSFVVTRTKGQSIIKAHCGETNAHHRCHLALNVPLATAQECGMEINGETTGWENGKAFIFLDAHSHHVWNKTNSERYVLIVDILRPQFEAQKWYICTRVILTQIHFMITSKFKLKMAYNTPSKTLNVLSTIFYLPIAGIILLNNRIGFLKL